MNNSLPFVVFESFVVKCFLLPKAIVASTILLLSPASILAQEPLRAGTIFSATQAPLWAAKEGRYFEKYGIKNLEVIQFSGGQPVTRALIGGDIQISTTGGAAVVNARLKGTDTVIIKKTWIGPGQGRCNVASGRLRYTPRLPGSGDRAGEFAAASLHVAG